jgi:hypothetical protein
MGQRLSTILRSSIGAELVGLLGGTGLCFDSLSSLPCPGWCGTGRFLLASRVASNKVLVLVPRV